MHDKQEKYFDKAVIAFLSIWMLIAAANNGRRLA